MIGLEDQDFSTIPIKHDNVLNKWKLLQLNDVQLILLQMDFGEIDNRAILKELTC